MSCMITRRRALKGLAQSAAGVLLLNDSLSARTYAANEKLNVALIGVGGRGKWYADVIPQQAKVVAFCDVNESKASAAYRAHPDIPKFRDFREMLDKMQKQIDGVIVATPDHTHAIALWFPPRFHLFPHQSRPASASAPFPPLWRSAPERPLTLGPQFGERPQRDLPRPVGHGSQVVQQHGQEGGVAEIPSQVRNVLLRLRAAGRVVVAHPRQVYSNTHRRPPLKNRQQVPSPQRCFIDRGENHVVAGLEVVSELPSALAGEGPGVRGSGF